MTPSPFPSPFRLAVVVLTLLWGVVPSAAPARAEPPHVVVSIKPLHSLAAAVMAGVGTPDLVVTGAASPHSYALKPSDAARLAQADLVFWMGEGLESYLIKPIAALSRRARVVELLETNGLTRLPTRTGGTWEAADHEDEEHGPEHGHGGTDAHVWLDIGNAQVLVDRIATELGARDPANAVAYGANATRLKARLAELDADLRAALAPVSERPFAVFHDAYQYVETRYALHAVGAIAVTPEHRPGARRLADLRARIKELGAVCVFAEPQFQPALLATVVEGTNARTGTLDPEGTGLKAGPDLYFTLMRSLADALRQCLLPAP